VPAALPEPSIAEPQPRTFDPDVARLDAQVAELLALEPAEAVDRTRVAIDRADGERRMRLTWIGARAAQRANLTDRALELFGIIAESDHPLSRWARLERVRILSATNAELAARVARSAHFPQYSIQRNITGELVEIVVAPDDRIGANQTVAQLGRSDGAVGTGGGGGRHGVRRGKAGRDARSEPA
jgi:hypothetical protein